MVLTLAKAGPQFAGSFNIALQTLSTANRNVIQISTHIKEMQRVMTQSIKFTAAQSIQRAVIGAMQSSIGWVKELNHELQMISTVSGKTGSELEKVYATIINGSKDLRVAASDFAEASLIFYQQGLSDAEVEKRTRITIQSAKAAGASVEDMSKQLTAIWNTYGMIGDEQQRAASVGAKLAATTAVDFADIAEAMQNSASAASQMGVSYNSLAAIIATVGDTTQQSASVIGNAYKTIFSRFQQLTTEGTDGEVTLNKVSSRLQDLGIKVMSASGELRKLDDIIMETGMNWNNWSEAQQLAIAELVGGTRQYGQFLALMQNFSKYQELLSVANNEDGSALESQYRKITDTVENAATNASEAWKRAFSNIFDVEAMKDIYNLIEDLGNIFDSILKGAGGFEGVLNIIAGILAKSIIPKLYEAYNLGKDLYMNSNITKQQEQVATNANNFRAGANSIEDSQARESALFKIDNYEQAAQAAIKINKLLSSASDITKLQGEYLQNQVNKYQEILNLKTDELDKALQILQTEQQTVEEAIRQAEIESNPVNQQGSDEAADKITELIAKYEGLNDKLQRYKDLLTEANDKYKEITGGRDSSQDTTVQGEQRQAAQEEIDRLTQQIDLVEAEKVEIEGMRRSWENVNEQTKEENAKLAAQKKEALEVVKAFQQLVQTSAKAVKNSNNKSGMAEGDIAAMQNLLKDKLTKAGVDVGTETGQKIMDNITNAISRMSDSGEISSSLTTIKEQIKQAIKIDAGDTENLRGIIDILDQITSAGIGLGQINGTLEGMDSRFTQLGMSAEIASQKMTGMMMGISGLVTGITNINNAAQNGDLVALASNFAMIGYQAKQAVGGITTLTAEIGLQMAISEQRAALVGKEITLENMKILAQKAGVVVSRDATIADIQQALAEKGLNVVVGENSVITAINAATWLTHPIFWLAAIVVGVVAVFAIWKKVLKEQAEQARASADETQELVDSTQELTQTIDENTQAVKDNVQAWKDAVSSGESAQEQYDSMVKSLETLNKELVKAGGNADYLNELMQGAILTGDFSNYYEEIARIQAQQNRELVTAIRNNNQKQLEALQAEMRADGGTSKTLSEEVYNTVNFEYESDDVFKSLSKELEAFGFEDGTYSLNIEFNYDNPKEFQKQYESLLKMEKEYRRVLGDDAKNNSNYKAIIDLIDRGAQAYEGLTDAAEQSQTAIKAALADEIEATSNLMQGANFSESRKAMTDLMQEVMALGEEAELTGEQMQALFNSIVNSSPQMMKWVQTAQKGQDIRDKLIANKGLSYSSDQEYVNAQNALNAQQQETRGGVGTWFNGLSATQEMQLKLIDSTGALTEKIKEQYSYGERSAAAEKLIAEYYSQAAGEIDAEKEALAQLDREWEDFMSGLTDKELELLPYINTDNIDGLDDVKNKLEALEEINLKVKIDYQSIIDASNEVQKNLGDAMKEYQKGTLSYETVEKLLALGPEYKRFIIDTAEGYVLSTEAIEKYNQSIIDEHEAINGLLNQKTDFSLPFADLAYAAADLSAMPESIAVPGIEQAAAQIASLTEQFWNGDIAKDEYFEGENGLLKQIDNLSNLASTLDLTQLEEMAPTMEALSNSLLGYIDKAKEAYAAGEIDGGQFTNELNRVKEAAQDLNNIQLNKLDKQLTGLRKTEDGLIDMTQDLTEQQKLLAKAFNLAKEKAETFEKASKKMDIGEEILGTTSQYYDKLKEIFNEEDLTLKVPAPEIDYSWLDEMNGKITEGLSTLDSEFREQLSGLITTAAEKVSQAYGLEENLANVTRDVAQYMVDNNVDFNEALTAVNQDAALSDEQIAQIHAAASATIVETGNQAMNEGMAETIDTLNQGQEEASKFSVRIGVKEAGIKGTFPVKFNILGKDFSFEIPKPYLELEAEDTGDMSFTKLLNGGGSSDTPTNPLSGLWDNYTGLGGSHPTLDTPSIGNPDNIMTDDQGTKRDDGKGGGNGKDYKNDAKVKDADKPEYRYEDIDSSIQSLTTTIEKLNAAEEDAWGKTKIRNLKALNFEISKQNTLLTSRLKEAKAYYDYDWANVINSSAINAAGFNASNITRNNDGSISNIEEIKTSLWETYVKPYIEAENNLIGSTNEEAVKAAQAATEAANKIYEDALGLLDKLDDSVQQYKDTLQKIVDNIRSMMSNIASEINSRLEFRIGIRERDLKRLEKLADRWGDLGVLNGETDKSLQRQWPKILQKMDNTVAEMDYTFAHINMLDAAKEKGKDSDEYQQIVKYMTKDMNEEQAKFFNKAFDEYLAGNAALPAEFADMLMDMRDSLEEYFNDAVDNQLQQLDNIFTRVNDWLDKTFAEWDNVLDFNDSILNWSDALLEYTGAYSANDLSMQESVRLQNTAKMQNAQGRLDSNIAKYNSYKEAIDSATGALDYIKKNLGNAVTMTAEEWGDKAAELEAAGDTVGAAGARMFAEFGAGAESMMQAQIDEWRSAQQDLMAEIVDSQTELLDIAQENIEREKEMAKKNVGTILNGLFTDLEDMADNYDKVKAEKDMTFDDYDQTYMTNKLQRMYDEYIEGADPAAIESMTKWQEKLNKYKEEMVTIDENGNEVVTHRLNMSQNEYDLLLKEFELEQAKAEWEDARNNKNTMRLARDASGNYSYVYSSDATTDDATDNAQNLADKEYEYKKMLESIQDETIATTTQIGIELQNTIDGINQYLWEHDEKYRESVKTKISALYKQLQNYGDESARIFDGLAVGVGEFGNIWDGSAGQILTGSTDMEGYIRDMATAICGPDGNMTTPDGSSYLGRILQAQEYWGTTANNALKESMKNMADGEDKDSIPSSFGDIGDRVLSVIEEEIGDPDLATSAYGKFKKNTETLQTQIDQLLVGDESSVWQSYKTLGTHTEEELGAIGNAHNDILFKKIKEYIGTPDEDSDTTVLGRIKKLKDDMVNLRNSTGTELKTITGQFQTWATEVIPKIQSVIDKIQEAIGKADELQNRSEPDDPNPDSPFTHPDDIGDVGQTIDPGIGIGVPTTTPSNPTPQESQKDSNRNRFLNYSFKGNVGDSGTRSDPKAGRIYYLDGAEVGRSGNGSTLESQVIQALINAGIPPTGGRVSWKVYHPDTLENVFSKFGLYTGGLVKDRGTYELAEKGPELVLNKEDTENILKAVSLMRQTVAAQFGSINGNLAGTVSSITNQAAPPVASTQPVDQQVHIEASFPGVSVAQEIEDALNSLITQAAQYNIKR